MKGSEHTLVKTRDMATSSKRPPPPKAPAPTVTHHHVALDVQNEWSVSAEQTEWYYINSQDQQVGPKRARDLRELHKKGVVRDSTYVWNENMQEWLPLAQAPIRE